MPVLFVPTMMAPIVVAILWKVMLAGSWGLLSYNVLERFGIFTGISVLASPALALYALILIDVWQWTPFVMLALFAGLQSLPVAPYRAAAVDGADVAADLPPPHRARCSPRSWPSSCCSASSTPSRSSTRSSCSPAAARAQATESLSLFTYKTVFDFWNLGTATATAVVIWIMFFVFSNVFYQVVRRTAAARSEPSAGRGRERAERDGGPLFTLVGRRRGRWSSCSPSCGWR